jgi:hypothetical protein
MLSEEMYRRSRRSLVSIPVSSSILLRKLSQSFLPFLAFIVLQGCTLLPMKVLKPVIAPPSIGGCSPDAAAPITQIQYRVPSDETDGAQRAASTTSVHSFDAYRQAIQTRVDSKLPPELAQDHVTVVFRDFLTSVSGEAQLVAQIHAPGFNVAQPAISSEQASIEKHYAAPKLKHSELKKFATKLFDLQLRHGPADFMNSDTNVVGLSSASRALAVSRPKAGNQLIAYLKAYYDGDFYDRMSTAITKPQLPTSIKSLSNFSVPDSEIVAAETVLLEFLIDTIDPTPVMGNKDGHPSGTTYYPGASSNEPTALATSYAGYVVLQPDGCGINLKNVWVLKDIANAASDQAAAVGGLIANTPGGISIGLGILGKISIGDNQTLSALVKAAASELALRATLTASYFTLKHINFDPPHLPGTNN